MLVSAARPLLAWTSASPAYGFRLLDVALLLLTWAQVLIWRS
jgi:hypothetical protein